MANADIHPANAPTLAVVVPAFNEAPGLRAFHARLRTVLDAVSGLATRILFVDDGSTDGTAALLEELSQEDAETAFLVLSRNFGKEVAMSAGLDHVDADAVVIIDADLQDPPELIPEMIERWREGYDVVYAQRTARRGESWLKRTTAAGFYRSMRHISTIEIPEDTGDFRLLSRRAVEALRRFRERRRFMKGLYAWIGFKQIAVPYAREPRHAGRSRFNYWRLWNFALEGITSFSTIPLQLFTYLGLTAALLAFGFGAWIIVKTLLWGDPVAGYPSMMVVILFLGGMQLLALGVIGEYLGRLFDESKQRPLYLLERQQTAAADEEAGPTAIDRAHSA
ncbi:MAG: glycosyltransferase family 2 protein [Pseudomonadota bacterium]